MHRSHNVRIANRWIPVPRIVWSIAIRKQVRRFDRELTAMPTNQRRVRDCATRLMIGTGRAVTASQVASELALPISTVDTLLTQLEQKKTYVVRGPTGSVQWAFPATVATTPHSLAMSCGTRLFGA